MTAQLAGPRRAAIAAISLVALACGSDSTAPTITPTLAIQAGNAQVSTVAMPAPAQPTVLVTDSHGAHPAGITVTFTPEAGAGSVAVPSAKTDANGVASSGSWTLGTRARDQHLTATAVVDGTTVQATFVATATPDSPVALSVASGGAQDGPYGATLVTPVRVLAADKYGNPTPRVRLRFAVDTGAVIDTAATTGTDGTAATRVRLPVTTGPVAFTASADSLPSVTTTLKSRGVRYASFTIDGNDMCGLSVEGYPYCWGDNGVGQLQLVGASTETSVPTPRAIAGDYNLRSISLANIGGCGIRADSAAVCWGVNRNGENGNGATSLQVEPPARVVDNLKFIELQRGASATCGTTWTGQSYCWGSSGVGQVGVASLYQGMSARPALVDGSRTFHSYALGTLHTCALDPAGQAYCWGMNLGGRLGVASASRACSTTTYSSTGAVTTATTCSPSPVAVNTSVRFTTLAATSSATCGLTSAGDAYCWGGNDYGETGSGTFTPDTVPVKVQGVPAFKELHGHDRGFCGLTAGGDIYCWGYVGSVLGVPFRNCSTYSDCTPTPTQVQVGRQFSTIAFSTSQLCGISNGTAYCWGVNYRGALGIGVSDGLPVSTPTPVAGQTP